MAYSGTISEEDSNDSIDDNIREFDTEQTNADTFYDGIIYFIYLIIDWLLFGWR